MTRAIASVLSLAAGIGLCCAQGCDRSQPPPSTGNTPPSTDPLVGAPAELPALLDWAAAQLRDAPPPVELPTDPRLATPQHSVYRFADEFWRTKVTCDWKPAEHAATPLAALGPFRSDQPQRAFLVQRRPDPNATGDALSVDISGFRVEREQIGSVALELRIPFGRHFDLVWSRAGRLRIPLPDNEKLWKLTLTTDGFAEWSGALEKLSLVTDGGGDGVIEVRSLRFLPREGSFLRPAGVRRVALDREARSVLYMHCPAEVRYEQVPVPRSGQLHVGFACIAADHAAGGSAIGSSQPATPPEAQHEANPAEVEFEIVITSDGVERVLPGPRVRIASAWNDARMDLSAWGGKTVAITLRAASAARDAVALWSDPTLYEPVDEPPLVIVYLIDTLAAQHIDLYGYSRATMPRLRALADNGVWFADMFANASRTIESIPNLFFSMYTERHGVDSPSAQAPQALVSLAEALRAAGFATASFCTNVNAGPRQALDQGFDSFFDRIGYFWTGEVVDRTVPIDDVIHWVKQRRDRPLFLYIHTAEPHAPYTPPQGFAGRFSGGYAGRIDGTYHPERGFQRSRDEVDLAHVCGLYDDEIAYADARLGEFLDALEAGGLRARSTILVTADHGEEFQQHGSWEHGNNLFGEVLRIPLVASGPDITARGRIDVPVQMLDIMPTLLELRDIPPPYPLDGQSLLPLMRSSAAPSIATVGPAPTADRSIFSSNHNYAGAGVIERSVIEAGRWKLLYNSRPIPTRSGKGLPSPSRFALFDLHADRAEQANIIDEQPEIARRLIGQLIARHRSSAPFAGTSGDSRELDARQLRDLQSLGYIGQ